MSHLVRNLEMQIKAYKLPEPLKEVRFAPPRRWRWDLAWPERMLAVEVDGGIWTQGRHSRGKGMVADMDKRNEAQLRGWRVLHFSNTHIEDGSAIDLIRRALGEVAA